MFDLYKDDVRKAAMKCEAEYNMYGFDDANEMVKTSARAIATAHNTLAVCVEADINNYISEGDIL